MFVKCWNVLFSGVQCVFLEWKVALEMVMMQLSSVFLCCGPVGGVTVSLF